MKKILVTGAYGFLGRHVSRLFKKNGDHVTGIGHGQWDRGEAEQWGIDEWKESDITQEALTRFDRTFDLIIHCVGSGSVGHSLAAPGDDFARTVQTSVNVLEYMRKTQAGSLLIYPSSAAVYGANNGMPMREGDILAPVSPYGYHKKIAEELCDSYGKNFDIRSVLIRFFSLYGPYLKKQILWEACRKFDAGEENVSFSGTGDETRDFLYIEDAAALIYALSGKSGNETVFNGASGSAVTVRHLMETLSSHFGGKRRILFNGISRVGDPQHYQADISKATSTGWKPSVNLDEGIRQYVAWYKSAKK